MTSVRFAAESLSKHGIWCRRDPLGGVGRWVAEYGMVQYCVGGAAILAAAASDNPVASLEAATA
jgi:hypothetical protein